MHYVNIKCMSQQNLIKQNMIILIQNMAWYDLYKTWHDLVQNMTGLIKNMIRLMQTRHDITCTLYDFQFYYNFYLHCVNIKCMPQQNFIFCVQV